MQEPLQKTAFSKQELLHCAGIVGAGLLYSLGINLFVVPAGLYTGGIMGFAQLLRTLFLYLTGLELKIDIAGIINYAINLPILFIAWKRLDHRVVFKTLLSVTSTTIFCPSSRAQAFCTVTSLPNASSAAYSAAAALASRSGWAARRAAWM